MAQKFRGYITHNPGSLDNLELIERDLPELTPTQVLVRMECSTINPSDYGVVLGTYPVPSYPIFSGAEGSGTIIKTGGDERAEALLNKRVALLARGTWSEYIAIDYSGVFPLQDNVSFEQAAGLIVNPMTVAYMIEIVRQENCAFAQNAAASSLGKQLSQLAQRLGIKHINLVRRAEQVEILKNKGAEHVFNTSEEGWLEKAQIVAKEIGVKVGFDAIGGKDTSFLGSLVAEKGNVYNYGFLSGENPQLSCMQLIFEQKHLSGLWLRPWLFGKDLAGKLEVSRFVQENIDILVNEYGIETDLEHLKESLVKYLNSSTGNKILVRIRGVNRE